MHAKRALLLAHQHLQKALGEGKCRASLEDLIWAKAAVTQAATHVLAAGEHRGPGRHRRGVNALMRSVNHAIAGYVDGPCLRATPYEKG